MPSPWIAAISSLLSFAIGALMPLLPYLFGLRALWLSGLLALTSLFAAGVVSARFTSRSWLFAGLRQLVLGALSAAVAFGVGHLFGQSVG